MTESTSTSINVIAGPGEMVPLDIPLELACSLILTRGGQQAYTMEDVLAASAALKKFKEIQEPVSAVLPLLLFFHESQLFAGTLPSAVHPAAAEPPAPSTIPVTIEAPLVVADVDLINLCSDPNTAQSVQEVLVSLVPGPERLSLIATLSSQVVALAQHSTGCRVIQKALDIGTLQERLILASAIPAGKIIELCIDVNANHVMQKLIEVLPTECVEFLVEQIAAPYTNTVARLSVHCYGCRVIQRVLSRCDLAQKGRVLDAICGAVGELVFDQFGNYVIQHALDFGREADRERIIEALAARDLQLLSCNKFASNVLEKAARLSQTNKAADKLVASLGRLWDQQLLDIMTDRYGNYVARAFLELSCEKFGELVRVRELVREHATMLKKHTYGWHLVEKLSGGRGVNKVTRGL
jgi:hypothetical protein